MSKTLELKYTDASNYKCNWKAVVSDELIRANNIQVSKTDCDFTNIEKLGLYMTDIPLVEQFGQGNDDHPYVEILSIK